MNVTSTPLTRLKEILGPQGWTQDPELIAPHLIEWRDRWSGSTPIMLSPANVAQAQAIMALCNAEGIAVTTHGGNTGLVGA